jgi:hypothetical protein
MIIIKEIRRINREGCCIIGVKLDAYSNSTRSFSEESGLGIGR